MKVEVTIPPLQSILASTVAVPLSKLGTRWTQSHLGVQGKLRGVYVLHHGGRIRYVGKTDGAKMDFATRLRREFQESAAQGKHIYPYLRLLDDALPICAHLIPIEEIKALVQSDIDLRDIDLIRLFELCLIGALRPDFQEQGEFHLVMALTQASGSNVTQTEIAERLKNLRLKAEPTE